MNQILVVKLEKKNKDNFIYKVQLVLSLIAIIVFLTLILVYKYDLEKQEKSSSNLLNNYSVSRLYSDYNINNSNNDSSNIIGIIEIPKINISYPIFQNLTDDLLKISPCRFHGSMPKTVSNLCIAGHNYNNNKFFSNIDKLNVDDNIFIYNNSMKKFTYIVYDIFEVEENDWSPINSRINNIPTLTLMTCNNQNKRRIIVKAKLFVKNRTK